ncbi:MAG TPA: DUF4254 domain-containing protein [Acidobacteriaceae bacterium]|jgi:hypothetical protein|nr:DUF4254 domain-containing protein [Acidobacteriaceae bacterium]
MSPSLSTLVDARAIVLLQDGRTRLWHELPPEPMVDESDARTVEALVEAQHAANFVLWHAEDEARRPSAGDASVAAVKREIDRVNQMRNDTGERLDALLLASLRAASPQDTSMQDGSMMDPGMDRGEQHSETPGMMMDRLSILSLKLFHTREELDREGAPQGHRERNAKRFSTLQDQRDDLAGCLERLWEQICAGERYFKQYRQLKMYNDPELNPILYGERRGVTGRRG